MLKNRDVHEVTTLFELSTDPAVYPYIRQKASTLDEFYFLTKQLITAEENGEVISRTILDEFEQPIGTISLYDLENGQGFLGTWIGKPYFGKGYNKLAKRLFFDELFFRLNIHTVFMKIRKSNDRSLKAVAKMGFASLANELYPEIYAAINEHSDEYHLFVITKEQYEAYIQFNDIQTASTEEDVS